MSDLSVIGAGQTGRLSNVIIEREYFSAKFVVFVAIFTAVIFGLILNLNWNDKVRVSGVLLPESGIIDLIADRDGIINQIHAKNQSYVTKGEPIFTFTANRAKKLELSSQKDFITNDWSLHKDYNQTINSKVQKDIELLEIRKKQIISGKNASKASLNLLLKIVSILRAEISSIKKLTETGISSKQTLNEKIKELLNTEFQASKISADIESYDLQLLEVIQEKEKLLLSLNENKLELKQHENKYYESNSKVKSEAEWQLTATTDGIVDFNDVKYGQSVHQYDVLATVYKKDKNLKVTIYIPPTDFGEVKIGNKVILKLRSNNYHANTRFNGIIGSLSSVSSKMPAKYLVGQDHSRYFSAEVLIDDSLTIMQLEKFKQEMNVDAEIIVSKQPLYTWLKSRVMK
jgi:membrane fusion protein